MGRFLLKISGAVATLAVIVVCSVSYLAQAEEPAMTNTLEVTPVSRHLKLTPGTDFDGEFMVVNGGSGSIDFRVYAEGYAMSDGGGEPIYGGSTARTELVRWISFDQTEYRGIVPGAQTAVKYHIAVPADSPDGGQYAVLFAAIVPAGVSSDDTNIQMINRAGMLIYADLGGETRKTGEVVKVEQPGFYTRGSIGSAIEVKNTGNVDFVVSYDYSVKSIFGKEVYKSSSNTNTSRIVLPGVTRNFTNEWQKTPVIGIYKVRNTVKFLGETKYDEEKLVIVAPIWLICLFGTIIIGIIALIMYKILHKRRRKMKF